MDAATASTRAASTARGTKIGGTATADDFTTVELFYILVLSLLLKGICLVQLVVL
jgi:hypothetical protein